MQHLQLSLNIYHWGARFQNRLLMDRLGPVLEELYYDDVVESFLFNRFDARGPHIFVSLIVPRDRREVLLKRLMSELDTFLEQHPSTEPLDPKELELRHAACRGKALCVIHRRPGLAENNTYLIEEEEEIQFPFWIRQPLSSDDVLRRLLTEQALWAIHQLTAQGGKTPLKAAIVWAAVFETTLRRTLGNAGGYWYFHASTLLLNLPKGIQPEDENEVAASVAPLVSAKNRESFTRVWDIVLESELAYPNVTQLVEILAPDPDGAEPQDWAPLRGFMHLSLKQLGLKVAFHIPIVVFSWLKNLDSRASSTESETSAQQGG